MRNGVIPSENIFLSSNDQNIDQIRLSYSKMWSPTKNDIAPSVKVVFDSPVNLTGFSIRGNAQKFRMFYLTEYAETYGLVRNNQFFRHPAELNGESRFTFDLITGVNEVLVEFDILSILNVTLEVQIELLGCGNSNFLFIYVYSIFDTKLHISFYFLS
jgi:hypothetical protein